MELKKRRSETTAPISARIDAILLRRFKERCELLKFSQTTVLEKLISDWLDSEDARQKQLDLFPRDDTR